jgi:uncharacterized protein (TIGR03435 family)
MILGMRAARRIRTLCGTIILTSLPHAQTPTPPANAPRLTFDVASIRQSSPTQHAPQAIQARSDGYTATYLPVKMMIAFMYRIPARQILDSPTWLEEDRYDVEAKADKKYNVDDLDTMYQNLLIDRFHLKFHIETRQANAYLLKIDKNGTRLKPSDQPPSYDLPINFSGLGVMTGTRVPMPFFCWMLGQLLQTDERPVVNMTGLNGLYDFHLSFLPTNLPQQELDRLPADTRDRPSLFEALHQQLGLNLTAGKGPVQYFVIDHIARPTEN